MPPKDIERLRRQAAAARAREALSRAEAEALEDVIRRLGVAVEALAAHERGGTGPASIATTRESVLTSKDRLSTLDDVNATPSSNAMRARKQLDANPAHPFVGMLKRSGRTVNEVATALSAHLKRNVPRNTVQSWYKKTTDAGFRRIPVEAADALEALYDLPADSWPRRAPTKK